MAIPSHTKAQINRASKQAQRQLYKLDDEQRNALKQVYRRAIAEMQQTIQRYGDNSGSLRLEVLQDLQAQISQHLTQLETQRNALFNQAFDDAAELGAAPFVAAGVNTTQAAIAASQQLHRFVAADGLQLSDRIWRVDNHSRRLLREAIEQAVIQGHSASRAVHDLLSTGQPIPPELQRKANGAQAANVARSARDLMQGDNNPYSNLLRVMRTEINRAHGEAFRNAGFELDGVVGTRFLLSPRHPERDICDMHASVNRYGLGPGVYPKGRSPWPAHPNTLSFEELVFDDEITTEDKAGKQTRIDWLKQQPIATQASVLGSQRKQAALQQGWLTERQIATPWRVLKQRYQRQGRDVEGLDAA